MAKKDFTVKVMSDEVMHTSISKSQGGYNSARIVAKRGDNEYLAINYEWEGDSIPSFAMDLMGFMQANELPFGKVVEGKEAAFEEYSKCATKPKKKKGEMMDDEDEMMDDEKKKKMKK
jgi:hypothetical protein